MLKDGFLTCEGSFLSTLNSLAEHISLHEQDITVTWDLVDAFLHVSSQLRVAFQRGYNVNPFSGLGLKPRTHFLEYRAKALPFRL